MTARILHIWAIREQQRRARNRQLVLLLIAILLAFANFELWMFNEIDRALERAETRRGIVMQDVRTKWLYQCYRTK